MLWYSPELIEASTGDPRVRSSSTPGTEGAVPGWGTISTEVKQTVNGKPDAWFAPKDADHRHNLTRKTSPTGTSHGWARERAANQHRRYPRNAGHSAVQ